MSQPQREKRSLRVYFAALDDGRVLGTLMRTRESFFDTDPPSAYGTDEADVLAQLGERLSALVATREDELDRYLWDEKFATRSVALEIHPATAVRKQPVVGKRVVPLRLTFAWSKTKGGAYRVMLPRFRWWLLLEDLEIAKEVLEHAVSGALLGEQPRWLYELRRQGEERVEAWTPDWLARRVEREPPPWQREHADVARPTVETVAEDWVERAAKKKLPDVVGDDPLFEEHARRLARRRPPSVLLVGERGVGKTTFVRRLAKRLLTWRRAGRVAPRRLFATSADRILAGMIYLGMWQERCLAIAEELHGEDELLYVDRLLDVLRPQHSGSSIADVLAPSVLEGMLPLVAECTPAELIEARRRAARFVDAFHVIRVDEPRQRAMVPVMTTYAERRGVELHPEAVERLVRHLDAFSRHVRFPGKGFALIDWLAQQERKRVDPAGASEAYARYAGMPLELVADERSATTDELAARLAAGVVGQDEACRRAAGVLARLKAGVSDPERPIGSLLFVGPTGVGKTELAKQLARVLFGSADRLIRVDLSEHMVPGSMARLIQAGPGVTSLAARVHQQPMSIVLLDELEKAHPEVFDLLLGVLGEGRLTDALGRAVDFRMTIVVMTSNLGVSERAAVGFDARPRDDYERAVRDAFRPELVNRIDAIVSFRSLTADDLARIVDLELARSLSRHGLRRRELSLLVDRDARARLAELGWHPTRGARPLRRVIEERVFTPLAARIASDPGFARRRVPVVARGSAAEAGLTDAERADAVVV